MTQQRLCMWFLQLLLLNTCSSSVKVAVFSKVVGKLQQHEGKMTSEEPDCYSTSSKS